MSCFLNRFGYDFSNAFRAIGLAPLTKPRDFSMRACFETLKRSSEVFPFLTKSALADPRLRQYAFLSLITFLIGRLMTEAGWGRAPIAIGTPLYFPPWRVPPVSWCWSQGAMDSTDARGESLLAPVTLKLYLPRSCQGFAFPLVRRVNLDGRRVLSVHLRTAHPESVNARAVANFSCFTISVRNFSVWIAPVTVALMLSAIIGSVRFEIFPRVGCPRFGPVAPHTPPKGGGVGLDPWTDFFDWTDWTDWTDLTGPI